MVAPRERRIVLNNAASLSSLQIVTYILPIITVPYLFRVLGADKFGLLAFAQAFIQYFIILTEYGFGVTATREISLCHHDHAKVTRAFSSVMSAKLALTVLSLILLAGIVGSVPKFRNDWQVYLLSAGTIVGTAAFPTWFFQGTEKMRHITILNSIGSILLAAALLLFVHSPADYLIVVLIHSLVSLITGWLGQYIVRKEFNIAFQWHSHKSIRNQFKAGWDIFLSIAAINAYTTTRIFILGLFTTQTLIGYYSIAERIANACQTFPLDSFSRALFPRLSKIYRHNKNKALILMHHIQKITTIIALICLPVIFISAKAIVQLVCGQPYQEAVTALHLLLFSVLIVAANAFRVQFLLVCGKTDLYSRIHVTMALLGLPLIFLMINTFSYVGAAIVTIAIEAGVFTMTFFVVRKLRFPR
jgi:PST family polysaccharide transporter